MPNDLQSLLQGLRNPVKSFPGPPGSPPPFDSGDLRNNAPPGVNRPDPNPIQVRFPERMAAPPTPHGTPVGPTTNTSPVVSPEGLDPQSRRQLMNELQRRMRAGEIPRPDEVRSPGVVPPGAGTPTLTPGEIQVALERIRGTQRVEPNPGSRTALSIPTSVLITTIQVIRQLLQGRVQVATTLVAANIFAKAVSEIINRLTERFSTPEEVKAAIDALPDETRRHLVNSLGRMPGILDWTDP